VNGFSGKARDRTVGAFRGPRGVGVFDYMRIKT
jgi:hypothetical protein